jgi:hypothetical protein
MQVLRRGARQTNIFVASQTTIAHTSQNHNGGLISSSAEPTVFPNSAQKLEFRLVTGHDRRTLPDEGLVWSAAGKIGEKPSPCLGADNTKTI